MAARGEVEPRLRLTTLDGLDVLAFCFAGFRAPTADGAARRGFFFEFEEGLARDFTTFTSS